MDRNEIKEEFYRVVQKNRDSINSSTIRLDPLKVFSVIVANPRIIESGPAERDGSNEGKEVCWFFAPELQ